MNWQDVLIRDMACKYHMTEQTMKEIVYSPIYFAKKVIRNNNDIRPIRVPLLGLFAEKKGFNKSQRLNSAYEKSKAFVISKGLGEDVLNKIEELYSKGLFDELVDYVKTLGLTIKYRKR